MRKKSLHNLLICTLLLSICVVSAFAQENAPLPELRSRRLLNDLQVTAAQTRYLGSDLAVGLVVRYGAAFDLKDKEGVANLLSRMLLKATLEKSAKEIQGELAQLGAAIDVQCDWDGFRIILKGQSSQVEWSLLLLYQVVCEAQFTEADFIAVRQSLLEDLQKPPDPRQQIHSQFESVLFGGTTYGRSIKGTARSLSSITVGDVRYFYRRFFSPGQSSLIIVGDVRASQVLQRASRIWGVWVRNEDIPFTFIAPSKPAGRQIYIEDDPSSPAAQFIIGNLFPRREDPAYVNAVLAARILQDRLTKLLPTSLLTVGYEGRRIASPFYVQGQAAADQAVEQIQKIEGAAEDLKISAVSKEELEAARNEVIDDFNRELRSPLGLCHILLDAELYRLGSNYAAAFSDRIRRCDADAIKQAAKNFLMPDGEVLLVRGPASILKSRLNPLGRVQNLAP
ncbi:MAG: insulinase family protein [Acidobacteria bacterium]|nr:insulinase family protein [Acidobacteriota bacterium]